MADVTKADLDALKQRIDNLEQIPRLKLSKVTGNAIHLEHDGGIFVDEGATQADLDKVTKEVQDAAAAQTKTATGLEAVTTAQTKAATELHELAAGHDKTAVAQAATSGQLAALDKEFRALVTKAEQTATAAANAATSAQVAQLEKELHELAAEHKKTADALAQAATSTQLDHVATQVQALSTKYDQLAAAVVTYTEGDGIHFQKTP